MDAIDRLLNGAVDLHCHSAPSPMPRRFDHVEAAESADQAQFRAIVVKCHYHNTAFDVQALRRDLAGVRTQVFGGIALNSQVGGLNPHAVALCLKMGGKLIWFPTISSKSHLEHAMADERVRKRFVPEGVMPSEEVDIFGEDGDLVPEVHQIIELAKEGGAVISPGHMDAERAMALLETAAAAGHKRLLVNHPNRYVHADDKQATRFAELGATLEHEVLMYDEDRVFPLDTLLHWINLVGPERTSLGSDLGQVGMPLPVEAYRRLCQRLLDSGISEKDVRLMVSTNPRQLLGLDE
jgi:hypothetical protein